MIITLQDQHLLDWTAARLHARWTPDAKTLALVDESENELLAVVVFDDFTEHNCMMHIASTTPRWGQASFIKACFRYAFLQCGLERVTFLTRADNGEVIELVQRLGAKEEGRMRRYFGDCDALLWGILWSECKWLKGKQNGQIKSSVATARA